MVRACPLMFKTDYTFKKGVRNNLKIMCLYPIRLQNKKYTVTEKNGGNIPSLPKIGKDENGFDIYDERIAYVQIPCGNCIECKKQKAREWQVRLTEELKEWQYPYFMTLTFSPEELENLCKKTNLKECNAVAEYALRHMLERWRKTHKKSLKHWFITELGHEGTERIHLHGIIFTNEIIDFGVKNEQKMCIWKYWKYGHVFVGDYCTRKTINYIVKYLNKIDSDHKTFKGQILASPGLGKTWIERMQKFRPELYKYKPRKTIDYYVLENGSRLKLPKYYANKLRSEEERELIWREFLDQEKETINGITYKTAETKNSTLGNIYEKAQEENIKQGYGNNSKKWRKEEWNITKRMLQKKRREEQIEKMRKALNMPTLGR